MIPPPVPDHEAARLRALRAYAVLDTPPEDAFDAFTRLASALLRVPIALVSLVDESRQWFKSRHGLDACATSREISFCGHVVAANAPLVVHDALSDVRFLDNPLVLGEPRVRFYAGVPLRAPGGVAIGTLCAIDHVPRELTAEELALMTLMADRVVDQLELRVRLLAAGDALEVEVAARMREGELRTAAETAARALAASERRLQDIVDGLAVPIVAADGGGIIRYANAAAHASFGFGHGELVGLPRRQLVASLPRAKTAGIHEVRALCKDGTEFPAELGVGESQLGGAGLTTWILRDLTAQRRGERLQAQFLAAINHEVRTPLMVILGLSEALRHEAPDPRRHRALGLIHDSGRRLLDLITSALDLARAEAGVLELDRRRLDLLALVRVGVEAARAEARERGHELRLADGSPADAYVSADPRRVAQMLRHLIDNAMKFTPAGGVITVGLCAAGRGHVEFFVQDDGPGIARADQAILFRRFGALDASTRRIQNGAGLGLALVRHLAVLHGAKVLLRSEPGRGSRFAVRFPRADAPGTGPT